MKVKFFRAYQTKTKCFKIEQNWKISFKPRILQEKNSKQKYIGQVDLSFLFWNIIVLNKIILIWVKKV